MVLKKMDVCRRADPSSMDLGQPRRTPFRTISLEETGNLPMYYLVVKGFVELFSSSHLFTESG